MQRPEEFYPDKLVKFRHECLESLGRDEVVARCETVACVDADSNAGVAFFWDKGDQVAEFGELAANCIAVAAHCFEDGDYGFGFLYGFREG